MASQDPEDFFGLVYDDAFGRHLNWHRTDDLLFGADLLDDEVPAVVVSKRGGRLYVAFNTNRLLGAVLAGPSGCGRRWGHGLVDWLHAVDASADRDRLDMLTLAQIVDEEGGVQ